MFVKSAQSNVPEIIPIIIITPPIVGVPDFFTMWSIGPSCLMGPVIIFSEKILIRGPPIIKTKTSEVITDNPVLNVKYLKTFKKEYWSTKEVKKWNNIYKPLIIFLVKLFKPVAFEPLIIK